MDNTNAADLPQGEGQPQRKHIHCLARRDIAPQMYMDQLEGLRASGIDVAGLHPLHAAANDGRVDIVRCMLDRGYDKDVLDSKGCTPLHDAAGLGSGSVAVAEALLAAGADVSLRCHDGMSPLDRAVDKGHGAIVTALLEHGADASAARPDGYTPLHAAALCDKPEMVSLLCLNGADVDKADVDGRTPLEVAARQGHAAAARTLLAAGADATHRADGNSMSALTWAAIHTRVDILMAIIEHGVDVKYVDGHGFTALHNAAAANMTAAIEVLLGAGADIDAHMDVDGSTPLIVASYQSNVSAVLVLLKHGASVNTRTETGRSALYYASTKAGKLGTAEVVDLLLKHGADEKAVDSDGQTPADVVGSKVEEEDSVAEDVERVRQLLANAPADRAWRRRGFLVLCRAHYPAGRVHLEHGSSHGHDTGIAKRTRCHPEPSEVEAEWAGVASMLMGVGADPISLMGDGADIIFQTIVGFL